MFLKRKDDTAQENENALLLQCLDQLIQGDFAAVDTSAFKDRVLAEKLDAVVASLYQSNNTLVMRLNDSMTRIGDSSCVQKMIEQVNSQTVAINDMRGSSQELEDSIGNIQTAVQNIQDNSHTVMETAHTCIEDLNSSIRIVDSSVDQVLQINDQIASFTDKAVKINEIIDMVKKIAQKCGMLALNASIEAARAGEAGKSFAVVANQIKGLSADTTASAEDAVRYVDELMRGITALSESIGSTAGELQAGNESVHRSVEEMDLITSQLSSISSEIDHISEEITTQFALTQNFVASIDTIADSYTTLSEECVSTGSHLYKISRDIDKTRSDMARKNSKLSTLDWITVFEVDHLIFTWRIYNNLADFEKLQITQLNNPDGCKLGKWLASQTDSTLVNSREFKKVAADHKELHKYACESWYAKDRGDREEALYQFKRAYGAYQHFLRSIADLRAYVRASGDTRETDISRK